MAEDPPRHGRAVDVLVSRAADARSHSAAADLFVLYQDEFRDELGDQDLCQEALWLAEEYGGPEAGLLVAWREGAAVGCIAFQGLGGGDCRLRRLYVRPEARGEGVGKALVEAALDAARAAGHQRVFLDTSGSMEAAEHLYRRLGFDDATAPYTSPCRRPRTMARRL